MILLLRITENLVLHTKCMQALYPQTRQGVCMQQGGPHSSGSRALGSRFQWARSGDTTWPLHAQRTEVHVIYIIHIIHVSQTAARSLHTRRLLPRLGRIRSALVHM